MTEYSAEGCSYGSMKIEGKELKMSSIVSDKPVLDLMMDKIALCVVPANNRDELEVQFMDVSEKSQQHEDALVQITLHFPAEEDEHTGVSAAEAFHKKVMDTGIIRSVTGNIIAEFSKEQGNFVTPRGKYSIQMTSSYFHMQGAQYAYKIKYEDINCLFLLPKLDGGRMAFVVALEKPIRQGNQKYQNLVLETHKVEQSLQINLTPEECGEQFDGQFEPEMIMPMSSLIAKVFKILSQKKVLIPKHFLSARKAHCVRCSIKANDGLLYPLAKVFVFINKPCAIVRFEDVEHVEFKRFERNANSATRNFDMILHMKEYVWNPQVPRPKDLPPEPKPRVHGVVEAGTAKEYGFMSIDRSEYGPLTDYLASKGIPILNPQSASQERDGAGVEGLADALGGEVDSGAEESDDGDYQSGQSSQSERDSDDSGSDDSDAGSDAGSEGVAAARKKKTTTKKRKASKAGSDDGAGGGASKGKKKRAKKDPNAPKGALGSYMLFSQQERSKVLAERPGLGVAEVGKEIGARWRALDAEAKKPFEELARADKQRYAAEMEEYRKRTASQGGEDEGGSDAED